MGDTDFEKRHLDIWVDTKTFGKLSLEWCSVAPDSASEVDLSGTSVGGY